MVKKKTGKRRVCVDFTDLNKACPKDLFPMPRIDQLVDTTIGHPRMNFLDELFGCLLRIPPDTPGTRWSGEDSFCYSYRKLSLQGDALWLEECNVNLSTDDDKNVWTIVGKECWSLYRWHGCEEQVGVRARTRSHKYFRNLKGAQVASERVQVFFWSRLRKFFGVHGDPQENWSKPRPNQNH